MRLAVVYKNCCPRCGGDISSFDVITGGCCGSCTRNPGSSSLTSLEILNKEVESLIRFFAKLTGFQPWSLQRYWIKRLVAGESFAMVAPTGVGKSTLLAVYTLYKAHYYKSKVYILTPTKEIAKQMYRRIQEYAEKGRLKDIKIVFYDSSGKNLDQTKNIIKNGDFDILITSAAFLSRHQELLVDKKFDVIIADDLDSIMKNSKSVDRILALLGFSNEDIEIALKITKLRQNMIIIKASRGQEAAEKLRKELLELEAILRNNIAKKNAQLVVASATGRTRGIKAQILKLLLGFDAGAVFEYWRNIVDLYHSLNESLYDVLTYVVKSLGSGIVFVSPLYKELIKVLADKLKSSGIKVEIAKSDNRSIDKFRKGEVDVLIGSASYYGILVRGFDEPIRSRYVVFIGIPSIIRDVQESLNNPRFLFMVLRELRRLGYSVDDMLNTVVDIITSSTHSMLYLYSKLMKQNDNVPVSEEIRSNVRKLLDIKERIYKLLKEVLNNIPVLELGKSCIVTKRRDRIIVIKPDPYTYIQASGRCSRLFRGSKTFGVSIIFDEYVQLASILENTLKRYIGTFNIKNLDLSELGKYAAEIERSRTKTYDISEDLKIYTALIVVESPTKARTIANMFGRPAKRVIGNALIYETLIPISATEIVVASVIPSLGHIVDLVTDEGLYGVKVYETSYIPIYDFISRCRSCGAQHVGIYDSCPYCNSMDITCSSTIYNAMKVLATQVDKVFIATDPDSEGEKIAFDIYNLLLPYNKNIYRIEFREVTRNAILEALRSPRGININKVEAQIARRIADRWIGFEVSLWLQMKFNKPWLGAGRVQSPILLWTSERYKEYQENLGYVLIVDIGGYSIKWYIGKGAEAKEKGYTILKKALEEGLHIVRAEFIEKELQPPPPFTTDSLIQEANMFYGFTASKTMSLAQTLFELGLITYHRTDTTRISAFGISIAREVLKKMALENMFIPRSWSKDSEEGAHEAIRPTNPFNSEELVEMILKGDVGILTKVGEDHLRLYDLIFRRFIASQMPSAKVKYLRAEVRIDDLNAVIELPINITSPGFTIIYPLKLYSNVLDNIDQANMRIKVRNAKIVRGSKTTLYRIADIIKLMKEKGIGRPSTYAKAIDNNIRHGYIITSKKMKVLIPTKLGLEVANIISNNFINLVGEYATKELEEFLDHIEFGRMSITELLNTIRSNIDVTMRSLGVGEIVSVLDNKAEVAIS